MAGDKAPAFQFYPRDFMADPGVQRLTWDQRGRYVWALCCSSLTETPGIALESDWQAWMGYDEAGWAANRASHLRCFRVDSEGCWTQRRMAEQRSEQHAYYDACSAGGLASAANLSKHARSERARHAAAARWASRLQADSSMLMLTDADTASASASASAENLETKTRRNGHANAPAVTAPRPDPEPTPDDLSWVDLFESWFWTVYPRKVGKPAALRAWKAVRPQSQQTIDAMAAGLKLWRATWTEPQFTPHPSTWLNQRRWEDKP